MCTSRSKLCTMVFLKYLIFLLLFCLSACDLNEQLLANLDVNDKEKQAVINFAIAQAPLNLDPRYASDAASERVNRLLYQPLVDFDESSKVTPKLASWKIISPTQIQFTLSDNRAPFHNGTTLTTHDVKATYDSFKTLKSTPHTAEFNGIDHIQVLDDLNLMFYLKSKDKDFVSKVIIGILPKALIEAKHDFSRSPIGNGPLQFVAWDQTLQLQRVRDKQLIRLLEVKDPTVRVLKLLRGEADVLQGDLPPELVKHLQDQPSIKVATGKGANFSYLGINHADPILKQAKVRRAVAHAIDTKAIIKTIMVSSTRQAGATLPPEHFAGNATLTPYDYQPEYAKQLLKEAGIALPLKLTYKTSTDAQRVRIATIMQAQMRKAGIELSIKSLDWGTFFEDVKQGHFQLYGLTWVGIKTPEIYQKVYHSGAMPPLGFNRGRFANADIDALLDQENWPAATAAIHQTLPTIPLWYEGQFMAAQKRMSITTPATDGNWDMLATIHRE